MNVFGSNNTVDKGTLETDTVENVLVLGNKNSASIDNKASASRDSGTPTVSGAIGIGNGVILGEENATAIGNGSKSTALNSLRQVRALKLPQKTQRQSGLVQLLPKERFSIRYRSKRIRNRYGCCRFLRISFGDKCGSYW